MYTNFENKPVGFAGQIARGDQSTSKAWPLTNLDKEDIAVGVFVAHDDEHKGCTKIKSAESKIAGIVVRPSLRPAVKAGDKADVMHIGQGDSIWAQVVAGDELKAGDDVAIVATGANAGMVTATAEANIATSYVCVRVSGDVAEITRKEV